MTSLTALERENRTLRGKSGGGFESETDGLMEVDQVCANPRKAKQDGNFRTCELSNKEQEREHL